MSISLIYPVSEKLQYALKHPKQPFTEDLVEEINSFFPAYYDIPFKSKKYLIRHQIEVPTCPYCKERLCRVTGSNAFTVTCGRQECINKETERVSYEKYGTRHPSQSTQVKDKQKQVMLEKYGVDNIFKKKDYIRQKTFEKYRVYNIFQNVSYIQQCCEKKLGVYNPTYKHIAKENLEILLDRDKFTAFYNSNFGSSAYIGYLLGVSGKCIRDKIAEYSITPHECHKGSSLESILHDEIFKWGVKILTGKRDIIPPYELDIYLPAVKVAIEVNGIYWHNDTVCDKDYHLMKSQMCEEKGIRLIHIFEHEWYDKEDLLLHFLKDTILKDANRVFARKCVVKEISGAEATSFLSDNHLQGKDISKVRLGLLYENELLEVATFCKPRFNKNYEWELSRLSTKRGFEVVGGASKLLKYFERNYAPKNLISYADRSKMTGNIYKVLGFTFQRFSDPNYTWVKGKSTLTRYQCQKHKLLKEGYGNLGNTEEEIMRNRGYSRLYDCGNYVFTKEYK